MWILRQIRQNNLLLSFIKKKYLEMGCLMLYFYFTKKPAIIIVKLFINLKTITMSVKIKPLARKNPQDLNEPVKYYAGKVNQGEVDLKIISKIIARESTISEYDVNEVMNRFIRLFPRLLKEGKIIRLGKLGSFCFTLSSTPSLRPEDVTVEKIKKLRLSFRPSKLLKEMIKKFPIKVSLY